VSETWQIAVYDGSQRTPVYVTEGSGRIQFGRQNRGESNPNADPNNPYFSVQQDGFQRIILASALEKAIPREHVWIEPLADGRVRVTNAHRMVPVGVDGSGQLRKLTGGAQQDASLPITLHIGDRKVHIAPRPETPEAPDFSLQSLAGSPAPPGGRTLNSSVFSTIAAPGQEQRLPMMLQVAMDVLQSAAISTDFFDLAVTGLVECMGLDSGRVLLRDNDEWKIRALKTAAHLSEVTRPSRQVLNTILKERRTCWQVPADQSQSIQFINALVAAPILARNGDVIGVLYGERGHGGRRIPGRSDSISELEAKVVEMFAQGVATGLARIELEERQAKLLKIENDLKIGREIQAGFLPEGPLPIAGWEITYHFQPAREVSGDFYDFFRLSNEYVAVVIADVCDKGIGAALYMTLLRSLLRAFARQESEGSGGRHAESIVRAAVELTNNYVAETHARASMFSSLFFGVLNTGTGALCYINAGHHAPVLLGPDSIKARLARTGPVLGLWPNTPFKVGRADVDHGDVLIAYTDGVTEALDRAGQFFTEERLLSLLERLTAKAPVLEAVVKALSEHSAGAEPYDDITMLAVRRR